MRLNIRSLKIPLLLVVMVWLPACSSPGSNQAQQAQALFQDRCKNVAGEKIYRKVENVEGILLLKVRPRQSDAQWRDRNYPGAAFASESSEDEYITSFLAYEHSWSPDGKVTPQYRGYINTDYLPQNPVNLRGYRYVDVISPKDGIRYRYTLIRKPRPTSKIGWIDTLLEKQATQEPNPRYGVTYEDHVIPEERVLGLASSTVKVVDLQTNEILGEFTSYSRGGGFDQITAQNSSPWLAAYKCPKNIRSAHEITRQFVDQILLPKQGD